MSETERILLKDQYDKWKKRYFFNIAVRMGQGTYDYNIDDFTDAKMEKEFIEELRFINQFRRRNK